MEEVFSKKQGTSTNPTIINQLAELENKIKMGYPAIEVQTATFKQWASIPKTIWEEIARKAKINRVELTVHAPFSGGAGEFPLITGLEQKGYNYVISEPSKEKVSMELKEILNTAANLGKIYGENVKVTMHLTSGVPATIWDKKYEEELKNYLRRNPEKFEEIKKDLLELGIINRDDYQRIRDPNDLPSWVYAVNLELALDTPEGYVLAGSTDISDRRYLIQRLESIREKIRKGIIEETVVDRIKRENESYWNKILTEMATMINRAARNLRDIDFLSGTFPYSAGELITYLKDFKENLDTISRTLDVLLYHMKKEGKTENIRYTIEFYNKINEMKSKIENFEKKINDLYKNYKDLSDFDLKSKMLDVLKQEKIVDEIKDFLTGNGRISLNLALEEINRNRVPLIKPFPEVAIDSAVDVVKRGVEKFLEDVKNDKEKIENIDKIFPKLFFEHIFPEDIGSRPDSLIKFINKSRKALIEAIEKYPEIKEKIVKKYGSLEKFSEEVIGVTFDVAHLKLFENYGYGKEDMVKWVRELKPYIKHVHLSEGKAGRDTHIPLGMEGDEIIKAELEELKDLLAKEGITAIHEVGGWYEGKFYEQFGPEYAYFIYKTIPQDVYSLSNIYSQSPLQTYYEVAYFSGMPSVFDYTTGFLGIPLDLGSKKERENPYQL